MSEGMILYARTMLDRLNHTTATEEAMLKELENMPPDLSKIYAQKLKTLVDFESTRQLIRNVFRWIAVSKRPPSIRDLWTAHNIQQTTRLCEPLEYEEKIMDQETFQANLVRHCLPLVEITSNGDSVQFIHTTVVQFLQGKNIETGDDEKCPMEFRIDDVSGHEFASLTCISYLRLDYVRLKDNRPDFLNVQSFRDYAVMNWERHCYKSQEKKVNFIASSCCDPVFERWVYHRANLDRAFRIQFAIGPGSVHPTPLHVAIYFGLFEVARSSFMDMAKRVDAAGSTPLHIAATQGSTKLVEGLLDAGARLDVADRNGYFPLHRAVRHGNYETVAILVKQHEAGITVSDKFSFTPLAIACQLGWKKCAEVLLKEFTIQDNIPKTAIALAVENCHYSIVRRFLEWDKALIEYCKEPLLQAARRGHTDMVKFLVDQDVDLFFKDRHSQTVLHKACISGRTELARFLVEEKKLHPDPADCSFRTPLYYAAEKGHIEIVKCLINSEANVNSLDRRQETPLFKPAGNGHLAVVEHLLDAGTDATRLDLWKRTPLRFAAMKGRFDIARMLLEQTEIKQDIPDWSGRTVLHNAALYLREGQEDIIDLLIQHGAEPNKRNGMTGGTALHEAVRRPTDQPPASEALIRRLIKFGVPVNGLDGTGRSPLFYANLNRNSTIVKVLLDEGAKDEASPLPMWHGQLLLPVNIQTQSPMHLAFLSGDDGFLHAILETNWGRSAITRQDGNGRTVIHLAAYFVLEGLLSLLLDHVSDHKVTTVDIPDTEGRTALHLAAHQGHLSIVNKLLHFGALAYSIDKQRFMPMHLAAEAGHLAIVSELLDTLPAQVERCLNAWDRCLPNSTPSRDDGVELAFLETLCAVRALIPVKWPEHFGVSLDAWKSDNRANLTDEVVFRLQSWDQERHSMASTLLMRAAFGGHVDVVELALARVPNMPLQAEHYAYPNALTLSAAHGHAKIASLLI
jgi:ankyrin repeat protein